MKVRFKGVNELKTALKEKADLKVVKRVVKQNGAELQAKAQRNSPVDTGTLKRSIQLTITDGGLTAEVEATVEYAPYVEWGTRYMDARPYVKPASVGHFLRTVQYIPVCFVLCSYVSFLSLEPFLSFPCTLDNTSILRSGGRIQHRTLYNS